MRVYLDSNIVIYLIERTPIWGPKASARIAASPANSDQFVVSDLTGLECRIGPSKSMDQAAPAQYDAFFHLKDVSVSPLSSSVCDRAAEIRARHRFHLADSLHLAVAVAAESDVCLTNDTRLNAFPGLLVEILS